MGFDKAGCKLVIHRTATVGMMKNTWRHVMFTNMRLVGSDMQSDGPQEGKTNSN